MPVKCRYNDGITAEVRIVRIQLSDGFLNIADDISGAPIDAWKIDDIQLLDEVKPDQPVRISSSEHSSSRVTLTDGEFIRTLTQALPTGTKSSMRQIPSWYQVIAYMVLVAVAAWGLYVAAPIALQAVANAIPLSWDQKLGDNFMRQFEKNVIATNENISMCNEGPGYVALTKLVDRLTVHARSPFQSRIYIINMKQVNALAAPGGHIVIFDGLIQEAQSPDEIAGVIAHEIGHIVKRHSTTAILREYGTSFIFDLIFGGEGIFSSIGQLLSSLSYSRGAEREADAVGLRLLDKANISARGFQDFFQRLDSKQKNIPGFTKYMSTHPPSDLRAAEANKFFREGKPSLSHKDWTSLKFACR